MSSGTAAAKAYLKCGHSGTDYAVAHVKPHGGNLEYMGSRALRCHSKEPPPAADYQAWLDGQIRRTIGGRCHGRTNITGEKLRRAVRMKRNGYSYAEIERALSNAQLRKWMIQLPPELAV